MQLLCVHADAFGFEARNPDPDIETAETETDAAVEDCLVVFVAVEPTDCSQPETTTEAAAAVVREGIEQLRTATLAVVPCQQLTDSPADDPEPVLSALAAQFETVVRVPLGWDVALDIQTRAHPFAVQHHRIEPESADVESDWLVVQNGEQMPAETAEVATETAEVLRWEQGELSPDADYLDRGVAFGLFNSDGPSGVGLQPRGVFARSLLEEFVAGKVCEFGALPVDHLDDSAYSVFRQRSATLPVRVVDQRGGAELLASDTAVPATTVPRLSALVAGLSGAVEEACEHVALITRLWDELGLSFEPVIRVQAAVLEDERETIAPLWEQFDGPVVLDRRSVADWLVKIEFVTFAGDEPATAPAVGIKNAPEELESGNELMLVQSLPVGGVEQTLTALCEKGQLPLWLSPVQLRLIPIEPSDHLADCDELAEQFEGAGIRVDIDDRDTAVRERLAGAETEGIPYYTVVGADEVDGETLGVTCREDGTDDELSAAELESRLLEEGVQPPTTGLTLPRYVSEY